MVLWKYTRLGLGVLLMLTLCGEVASAYDASTETTQSEDQVADRLETASAGTGSALATQAPSGSLARIPQFLRQ